MREVALGRASAFPDPGRRVVDIDGIEIGVFCRNGSFTAFENVCPHMGGPVCQGKIIARVKELIAQDKTSMGLSFSQDHTNIVCPWHGYEFDIGTGQNQGNRVNTALPRRPADAPDLRPAGPAASPLPPNACGQCAGGCPPAKSA